MLLLSAVAFLHLFGGCADVSDKTNAASSPSDVATDQASTEESGPPRLVAKVAAGEDMRYVLDYQGLKFHIVSGDSGILGIKYLVLQEDVVWDNLWITFSPRRERPRAHSAEELVPATEKNLDYIPEGLREYVRKAQEMALYLAPDEPVVGSEAAFPAERPPVIVGVNLSPIAVNEMAIFARTDRLCVVQNYRFHVDELPEELWQHSWLKLNETLALVAYTPGSSWFRAKLITHGFNSSFLVLQKSPEDIVGYAQTRRRGMTEVEECISSREGFLTKTCYTDEAALMELAIPKGLPEPAGNLLILLDAGLIDLPEGLQTETVALATALRDREQVDDYMMQREGRRGIDSILQEHERGE